MKKLFAVLGILVAVLLAVLLIRTATVKSRQVQVAPMKDLDVDAHIAALRLARALRFPTISHEDGGNVETEAFRGLHAYLAQSFPLVHGSLTHEVVADYSLLYTWRGKRSSLPPILLMSHLDVVPVEPGTEKDWTHPAFSGMIEGGWIWGRGALDDKVGVLAILEAAEALLLQGFQPERTIYFAFGHDEEVGGRKGAAAIARLLEGRGVRPEFILDEGGVIAEGMIAGLDKPAAMIGTAEKGYLSVELVAEAPGGHSSMPPPHSAIGELAAAVRKLEDNPLPARIVGATKSSYEYLAPELPFGTRMVLANLWLFGPMVTSQSASSPAGNARVRTTTAATVFQGGIKENVLPHRARAVVNFRLLPGDSIASVLRHVRDTVGPGIKVAPTGNSNTEPSPESEVGAPAFVRLQETVREIVPGAVVAPNLLAGGTDTKHYARLSPNIYRFLPMRLKEADLARIHGTNERIGVENYVEIVRFYARLMRNGAG